MHAVTGSQASHRNRQGDIPLSNVTGGILDYPVGNERTFPILDALANICISEPMGQVIAIGLQLELDQGKICLTVAENGKVKEGVVEYLREVWEIIRGMSAKFLENRMQGGCQPEERSLQSRRVSPIMPQDVARDSRIRLFRLIYSYTHVKHRMRINRWLPELQAFMKRLYKDRGTQFQGNEQDLQTTYRALLRAFRDYDVKPLSMHHDTYWQTLYSLLEVATFHAKHLTRERFYFCEALVSQVGKSGLLIFLSFCFYFLLFILLFQYRILFAVLTLFFLDRDIEGQMKFDLRHALQKLTSQHRNLEVLIGFAHSPRLQHSLGCLLSIVTVTPPPQRPVVLPQTTAHWKAIIQRIVPASQSVGKNWEKREAEILHGRFLKHEKLAAPVHCECSLIEYFAKASQLHYNASHNYPRAWARKGRSKLPRSYCLNEGQAEQSSTISGRGGLSCREDNGKRTHSIVDHWKGVPAFSYIGVSKLSCAPCHLWIQGYNEKCRPRFYTRGTHMKWYWPWGQSQFREGEIAKHMVERVSGIYYEHCRANHRLRSPSDGSNAGGNNVVRAIDAQDRERTAAYIANMQE